MTLNTAVALSQIAATLVVAIALMLTVLQLREIQAQTKLTRQSRIAQGTMELIKYLMSDNIKTAEHHCDSIGNKAFGRWKGDERAAVITMIDALDVAGIFIRSELADERIIVNNWGALIRHTAAIGAPIIAETRRKYGTDMYWDDFEWLASRSSIQHS